MRALRGPRSAIPVLLYHAVTSSPSSWVAPFTVTADGLARHLALVVESGRTPLTVHRLVAGLSGAEPLPDRPVAITFDDGFADLVDVVAPLLEERHLCATAFLTTGFVGAVSPGGDRMVSWVGAREFADAGNEIGAHSVTHPQLDTVTASRQRYEVTACRRELQDHLGLSIPDFAYPHGYSDPRVRRLVAAAGYESACAVRNSFSHPRDRRDAIARLTVTAHTGEATIAAWLSGSGARLARRRDTPATYGWRLTRRVRSRL